MCLGCRRTASKPEFIRLVAGPGGVVVDEGRALPGRGAYICRSVSCAERACRLLGKALRVSGLEVDPVLVRRAVTGGSGTDPAP